MLTIVAPTFTLPPPAGGEATFETPFILTPDSFLVFAFDPNVIRLPVAGSGRATTRFIITDEPGLGLVYTTQGITCGFDPSPAAVPEPASLLLVGGGLAAVWARRRRARNVAR
jgi:PEP-CTERM motif